MVHEDALVGLEARGGAQLGSLDGRGTFRGNGAGDGAVDLTQTLVGTLRVAREGQLTLSAPVVESGRFVPGLTQWGGGLGDVSLAFRYDFRLAGESLRSPGVAVLASVLFPTGRSPEQAQLALGSDATGSGAWQGSLGAAVEQTFGRVFVQGSALVQQRLPRRVGSVTELLGTGFLVGGAAGWVFESGGALGLSASTAVALPAWLDGVLTKDTARWRTSLGVAAAFPLSDAWRLQGSWVTQLPVGLNELTSTTVSVLLMRTWS